MRDAAAIDQMGIRTVLLAHDAFEAAAKVGLRALGVPDLPLVIIRQPIYLDPEEERQKAKDALDKVVALLTGTKGKG